MNRTPQVINEPEAARWLDISRHTLSEWRRLGIGPPHIAYGVRCKRYRLSDLAAWQDHHVLQSRERKKRGHRDVSATD